MVVILGGFDDPWLFDLAAGQYVSLMSQLVGFPALLFPPIVRGPDAIDLAYEDSIPVAAVYAQQGLFVDLRIARQARPIQFTPTEVDRMMADTLVRTIRSALG